MDARRNCVALAALCLLSLGASYRTTNFIVRAPSPEFAKKTGDLAEHYRRTLAIEWLGRELPRWPQPCPITVNVGERMGASGATSFTFYNDQPHDWTMEIYGPPDRVLDAVLPHEVTHTIFATHFGRPLPRWADEGACTTVEHISERKKQERMLITFLTTNRGIAFNKMFAMKEYPRDVMPLYSQGYSLARFLIAQGGKQKFVEYIGNGMDWNNWTAATKKHYGFSSLSDLQTQWLEWVRRGSPEGETGGPQLASNTTPPDSAVVVQPPLGSQGVSDNQALANAAPQSMAGQPLAVSQAMAVQHEAVQTAGPLTPVGSSPAAPIALSGSNVLAASNTPATMAAASTSDDPDGWYARQRDLAAGNEEPSTLVTRPQPLGRPQQHSIPGQGYPAAPVVIGGPIQGPRARTASQPPARIYYDPGAMRR